MEVRYGDPDLRALCESDRDLRRKYGSECAKKIRTRLQALRVADSIDDLMQMPGHCHPLKGDYYEDCYAFRLHGAMRLIFRPMTDEERAAEGIPDVQTALVVEIINYHCG
ncbi:type II toxin-antitoxin system RelE/ParE family toxin [Actinomadura gamaensis]|uniref:Type II toxin-antitoxin system RelE/ParE family toxin n=1 Tax=Actinomadura gamaensis TaxID=1763541 RepID=A0ABV9UAF0_9ACTN